MSNSSAPQSANILESRTIAGLKGLAIVGSVLVYVLIVVYAEYHFFNLISGFVPNGMQIVGMIAVGASGITALLLPVALHFWFRSGLQNIIGYIFYGTHFLMMFANLILDSSLQGAAIAETPDWIRTVYAPYLLPGYIAFYALAWSVLWFTDANSQRIDKRREVVQIEEDGKLDRQIALARFKSNATTAAFNSQAAQETVNRYIAQNAPALLAIELGMSIEELGAQSASFEYWLKPAIEEDKKIVAAASPAPVATDTRPPVNMMRRPIQPDPLDIYTTVDTAESRPRYRVVIRDDLSQKQLHDFGTDSWDEVGVIVSKYRPTTRTVSEWNGTDYVVLVRHHPWSLPGDGKVGEDAPRPINGRPE